MARKLVIFSDCCWVRPQLRSKNRRVPGNVSIAHQCLLPTDVHGNDQISYFRDSDRPFPRSRRLIRRYTGIGLKSEIFDNYRFLVENYQVGDDIYLLGAGLGAFNLRRLADLIDRVGLLEPEDIHLLPTVFEYSQIPFDALDTPAAKIFERQLNGRHVRIRFLGCWDTVGSFGLPIIGLNRISQSWMMLHDHKVNGNVDNAFQALALDEGRRLYKPGLWVGAHSPSLGQIEQVWFAGSHENVVGGRRDSGLSDIALAWLLDRAQSQGLNLDTERLQELSAPDVNGQLARKRRKFLGLPLSLTRYYVRPIDQTSAGFSGFSRMIPEKIHESVLTKQQQDLSYRPYQLTSLQPGDIPIFRDHAENFENKRRHFRRKVDWPAFILDGDEKLNASLVDFSKSGACVWLRGKVPVGTTIVLQSSRAFVDGLKSRVVWAKDNFLGLEFVRPMRIDQSV